MPSILVRDIEPMVLEKLKQTAGRNGRSVQSEVRILISDYVNNQPLSDIEAARKIKKVLSGRFHTDSAELLREDRDR